MYWIHWLQWLNLVSPIISSNKKNKYTNFQLIASTKKNLAIAEDQILQDVVLATTTCHTLSLELESTLLVGLVVIWKYIFQVEVMFVWARHKLLYVHINTIYVTLADDQIRHPRDFEILGWCPAGPVFPHRKKVAL